MHTVHGKEQSRNVFLNFIYDEFTRIFYLQTFVVVERMGWREQSTLSTLEQKVCFSYFFKLLLLFKVIKINFTTNSHQRGRIALCLCTLDWVCNSLSDIQGDKVCEDFWQTNKVVLIKIWKIYFTCNHL